MPRLDRAAEICGALGLELYVGPPRDLAAINPVAEPQHLVSYEEIASTSPEEVAAVKDVVDRRDTLLWGEVAEKLGARLADILRDELAACLPAISAAPGDMPGARPVDIRELAAAAGGGAMEFDETVTGRVWFRREWLERHALDPARCSVIGVVGESMEPTLPDGCSILIDRRRRQPRDNRIYAVRASDGLVVKRADKDAAGRWLMVSDHPAWAPLPWPTDAAVVGEVRWMARML